MRVTDKIKVTKVVMEYYNTHTKKETYLYNNRLWFSKLITDKEYNTNWLFIKSKCSVTINK